jgi:23S rRNA (cytidine1920-2'-O)/16S rRNA (cytidine1409-2'-O)-methyltransferase
MILAGLVVVDGRPCDKAGTAFTDDVVVSVKATRRFVSRAGEKLADALAAFGVDPRGHCALDVGASTGGFVDVLLQAGASQVIALDVGRGQLDARLRADVRVHVMERVNARYLAPAMLPYEPDLLTMDVSFISVEKLLPAVFACMAAEFEGVILVKPQFEAGPRQVGRGGIVRDPSVRRQVVWERSRFIIDHTDIALLGLHQSKVAGAGGNVEYFMHVGRGREKGVGLDRLEAVVDACVHGEERGGSEAVR